MAIDGRQVRIEGTIPPPSGVAALLSVLILDLTGDHMVIRVVPGVNIRFCHQRRRAFDVIKDSRMTDETFCGS